MIGLEQLEFKQKRLLKYLALAHITTIEELIIYDATYLIKFKHIGIKAVLDINDALIKAGFKPLENIDIIHKYVEDEKERVRLYQIKQHIEHEEYLKEKRKQDLIQRKIDIPRIIANYKQKIIDLKKELKTLNKK